MVIHRYTAELPDLSALSTHPAPAQLATALETAIAHSCGEDYSALNNGQKAFLSSWLLTLSGYMSGVTEEKRRLNGEIPVRRIPPASSQVRTALIEDKLYDALFSGRLKPEEVRSITNPDEIVFTAHPNFSEKKELVAIGQKILREFLDTDADLLTDIAQGGYKADKTMERLFESRGLDSLFRQALKHMEPRTPRSRADELYESTVDFIPSVMESGIEEAATIIRRAKNVNSAFVPKVLNTNQLDALSAATSTHGTWFTDGDGKRTSRAWDNEFAIVAIKRKTLETQLGYLNEVIGGMTPEAPLKKETAELAQSLAHDIKVFAKVEAAAQTRMQALTTLQTEHERNPTLAREDKNFSKFRDSALAASRDYRALITEHGKSLQENKSGKVLALVKKLKTSEARGEQSFSGFKSKFDGQTPLTSLDALYLVAKKGDFPIKLERRENANQYKETIRHFLDFSEVKDALLSYKHKGAKPLDREIYDAARGKNDEALLKVLEVIGDILDNEKGRDANDRGLTNKLRNALANAYTNNARLIEPQNAHEKNPPPERRPVASELALEKALLLDDLSNLWISTLYPEAYKRTIIAEAATPDLDTLRAFGSRKGEDAIREAVLLRGKSDMLTVNVLRRLIGSQMEETSLYEDPHAILHTPSLLEATLKDEHYHSALGIDMEKAHERRMCKLAADGSAEPMTAYDFMQQRGFSDAALEASGLNARKLKNTYVYVGPAKQLANSDSAKRGTLATATLNDVTIRECFVTACKNPISDGEDNYIYVNPTYLGQGGTLARTTGVTLFAPIYTEQGAHPHYKNGLFSAVEKVNRMLGRMSEAYSGEHDMGLTPEGLERVTQETMPLGNPHGLRNPGIAAEKRSAMDAVAARIKATRDDKEVTHQDKEGREVTTTRYEWMLSRYGVSGMSNYSARPKSKSSIDDFINTRAIGLNGKEFGIWSVIFGMSEMFDFDDKGALKNLDRMAKYYTQDQTGQHNFTAAIFSLNMFAETVERKWRQGGIAMEKNTQGVLLEKGGNKVSLAELDAAYREGSENHKGFDAADMAFAHVQYQAEQLLSGLEQVKRSIGDGKSRGRYRQSEPQRQPVDPIALVPEHLQPTVNAYRARVGQIFDVIEEVSAIPRENRTPQDNMSLRMALDAHYVLMEAGPPAISGIELIKGRNPSSPAKG